jgi:FlaA1/EpsC-like NDP-sugar epimerase
MNASKPERHIDALLALPRSAKQTLTILVDSALCVLTVWLAICFRFESWISLSGYQWLAVVLSVFLAIPLLASFGFYHTVIRFAGKQTITAALRAIGVYAVIYASVFTAYGLPLVPRTIGVLQPLLLLVCLALSRLLARELLSEQIEGIKQSSLLPTVLIYGAGNSGQQLATSIQTNQSSRVVGFIDDNPNLYKASIAGIPVYSLTQLDFLVQRHHVRDVLLAMPRLSRSRRNVILKKISQHNIVIRTLPSLDELAQGKVDQSELRELNIEDLLGRDPVQPVYDLLTRNIKGKIVLVTGAGGSIGSELCRQIIKLAPKGMILVDASEYGLYRINEQLLIANQHFSSPVPVIPVLLDVQNLASLESTLARYRPHTIYHAAAYKHVPLIEANPVVGLKNNVLGTLNVAKSAQRFNVEDMVLISTDKAVRPTNIMGASKRISELLLQALAKSGSDESHTTQFSIVRFGNVLGSSGSVVPKFVEQIKQGGPVTLTHPDVTRYFMTIPEAALLVIQAGAMQRKSAQNTPVYLLDMGESVKILDLAKTLIHLSSRSIKDTDNPEGHIAIEYVGLRPGEKLFEELLVSNDAVHTEHTKIMVSNDAGEVSQAWMQATLEAIRNLSDESDFQAVKELLCSPLIAYKPSHE